jgi:alcohol dehydrogenase
MKALVYHGPGQRSWDTLADPGIIDPTDIVVRITCSTICGTDLHILKGDVPETVPGTVLGHEAVGIVEEIGAGVSSVAVGDRVLLSCISACGRCRFCKQASYGQCLGGGGWILGHLVDGTQAGFVRVPFADTSLHAIPDGVSDEAALMLSDITPTAYEVGVLNGNVRPGDTVVVVGSGPIGLAAIVTAQLFSPAHIVAVDVAANRLEAATRFGADVVFDAQRGQAELDAVVADLTEGLGADVVFEAVGTPGTFETCTRLVRAGGHVANIGVHGAAAPLHLESLWIKNITITTGLVDTFSTPKLLTMVADGQIDTARIVTHHFGLHEMDEAYKVFSNASETGALKVMLTRD